jgi:hypothetical protein
MELEDGTRVERTRGTPQGGVISPVLANLFMHYTFDAWMARAYPNFPWCRYADDGLIHCHTKSMAETLKRRLAKRLAECQLEMHPDKTSIVYCKDGWRKGKYPTVKFDFLGYCFKPQSAKKSGSDTLFLSFGPEVSAASLKTMRQRIRNMRVRRRTHERLADIAVELNPILQGWLNYYACYTPAAMYPLWRYVNASLVAWTMRKYKRYKRHKIKAGQMIASIAVKRPKLFVHWHQTRLGSFA